MDESLRVENRAEVEIERTDESIRRIETLLGRTEALAARSVGVRALEKVAAEIGACFTEVLAGIARCGHLLHAEMDRGDPLRRYARLILAHAETGSRLTSRLISLGERGRVHLIPVDMNHLVAELSRFLAGLTKRGIRMKTALAEGELRVAADPPQIGRVFASLVRYLGEAMESGGTMTVATRLVPVRMGAGGQRSRGCALLSIRSADVDAHAASRRGPRPPVRAGKSFLLAFSSIKRIVEEHRGAIRVDGQRGRTMEFNIYLPVLAGLP